LGEHRWQAGIQIQSLGLGSLTEEPLKHSIATPLCRFAGVEYITYLAENVGLQPARARWCSRRCDAIAHATHAENVKKKKQKQK
jgi:hypothetical protein